MGVPDGLQLANITKQKISVRIDETFNADIFKGQGWDIPANDQKINRQYTAQ
jgi:hypothetical protein